MLQLLAQFLGLFIPSIIAVLGSYKLYKMRRNDRKNGLRESLIAEIESAEAIEGKQKFIKDSDNPPGHNVFPNAVYSSNSSDLGLLTTEERESVVEYYTNGYILQEMTYTWREYDVNDKEPPGDLRNFMVRQIDKVDGLQTAALQKLRSNTSD